MGTTKKEIFTMKKGLIGIIIVFMVFLTGSGLAKEKKIQLSFNYQQFSFNTELGEKSAVQLNEWSRKEITEFTGREVVNRMGLRLSCPLFSNVTVFGLMGTAQVESFFYDPMYVYSSRNYKGDPIEGDSVSGIAKKGYFGGAGIIFTIIKDNNIQVDAEISHLQQKNDLNIVLDEVHDGYTNIYTDDMGDYGALVSWDWKSEIQKTNFKETKIVLRLTKDFNKASVTVGSELAWVEIENSGHYDYNYSAEYEGRPYWNSKHDIDYDFTIKVQNQEKLGAFLKANLMISENIGISLNIFTGARNGLTAGLTINL
jgi:hypothetical protein